MRGCLKNACREEIYRMRAAVSSARLVGSGKTLISLKERRADGAQRLKTVVPGFKIRGRPFYVKNL